MEIKYKLAQIKEAASQVLQAAGGKKVFAFHGEMGTGKTTLIHAICEALHVKDTVGSPTFSIINEYDYVENDESGKIFHIDLYRLKDEEEAVRAGVEDCLYSDHYCFVEWPGKIPHLLPVETLHIHIKAMDQQTRQLLL